MLAEHPICGNLSNPTNSELSEADLRELLLKLGSDGAAGSADTRALREEQVPEITVEEGGDVSVLTVSVSLSTSIAPTMFAA